MGFSVCLFSEKGGGERLGFFLICDENDGSVRGFFGRVLGYMQQSSSQRTEGNCSQRDFSCQLFFQDMVFLVELNNHLMWMFSNGKFNT